MSVEGEIVVRVAWDGQRVRDARVASSRPFAASRVLEGLTPSEAVQRLPRLFSICGNAQSAACSRALTGAGATVEGAMLAADVALETVQEYFWRLLIDWPHTMHRDVDAAGVADVRRAIASQTGEPGAARRNGGTEALRDLAATLRTIAEQKIYGIPPAEWLTLSDDGALTAWIERAATLPARLLGLLLDTMPSLGRSDVALMPPPRREALLDAVVPAMVRRAQFAAAPTWHGEPVETGALARMRSQPLVASLLARHGNSVAVRMAARLAELATLLAGLDSRSVRDPGALAESVPLADGEGLGAVQTARGLLLHRARVADGRITRYQIVAPTEWNFHPEGALARGLRGVIAQDCATLEQKTRLAVQGLDPCVAFRIEIRDA